jgi:hypothetical protein
MFLPLLAASLATTWYGLWPAVARFAALTGGQRFVDMQPGLTASALIAQAQRYPPEAVRFYLGWSLFDYAWPLVTFTTMLFVAAWLLRPLPLRWQATLPALAAAAYATVALDWAENLGFVGVVLGADGEPAWLARLAVAAHRGKIAGVLVFNLAFLVVLVRALGAWTGRLATRSRPGV